MADHTAAALGHTQRIRFFHGHNRRLTPTSRDVARQYITLSADTGHQQVYFFLSVLTFLPRLNPGCRTDCPFGANLLKTEQPVHDVISMIGCCRRFELPDNRPAGKMPHWLHLAVSIILASPCLDTRTAQAPRTIITRKFIPFQRIFDGCSDLFDVERIHYFEVFPQYFNQIFQMTFRLAAPERKTPGTGMSW